MHIRTTRSLVNLPRVAPLLALSLLLQMVTFVIPAEAQTTIHVPGDASTIQAGIDAAANGDTVIVAPGTYNENIDFKGKAVTVTSGARAFSDAAVAATIINGSADGPVVSFVTNEPTSAVLNGFTVQNGHISLFSEPNGCGISIDNASPTISNNVVTNNFDCGVLVSNLAGPLLEGNDIKNSVATLNGLGSGYQGTGLAIASGGNVQVIGNTIEDNVAENVNTNDSHCCGGVAIQSATQVLLQNNIIRNNQSSQGTGLGLFESTTPTKLVLIQNLIYGNHEAHNDETSTQIHLFGATQPPYPSVTEINNTIYGIGGQEMALFFAPSLIANNIFVNTAPVTSTPTLIFPALACEETPAQNASWTIDHNDIFNAGILQPSGCTLGPGNIAVDPQLVNPTGGDLHAQPTSPVIAAGDINAPDILSADLDGKARTVCNTIDMGVYEVHPHPAINLQTSANPIAGGSSVTFTARVPGNCNTPTGTISFLDGTTVIGTAMLNGLGSASFTTSSLFVGTHPITVTYPGDFNFDNGTSNLISEVVTGYPTTTGLNVAPIPANAFQSITLTATVTSAFGTPTGTVTFIAGGAALGSAVLNGSGIATTTISTLGAGNYSITAVYGGSPTFAGSTSAVVQEKVLGANTATSLAAAPNPVIFGQTLTLTATVAATQGNGVPTGSVNFLDGAQPLGSAVLNTKGVAVLNTSSLALGMHRITVSYAGSPNANASASAPINVVVEPIPTSIGLTSTPNPANFGQTVTFAASVTAAGTLPAGIVTFFDQGKDLGSAALNGSGTASFATAALTPGTHPITATLSPTGPYGSSTSAVLDESILNYNFSLSVSSISLTLPSGGYQVLTLTVTPVGGFPGTVALGCASVPTHTLCNFKPSTSPPLSNGAQTVQFTVNTSDVLGYGQRVGKLTLPGFPSRENGSPRLAGVLFPLMMLCGLVGAATRRLDLRLRRLFLLVAIAGLSFSVAACSGKLPGVTPPGTYTVTVTGADTDPTSSIVHTVNLQLTVTP